MISLKNINKKYKKKFALKNINLDFKNTGLVFILGESGAGKSTLLNILALLDKPSSGEYYFNETKTSKLSNRRKDQIRSDYVGVVFQNLNLLEELTIKENLELPKFIQNKNNENIDYKEYLKTVNMDENLDDFPSNLSGGERQRLAILRALNKDTKLLLADEPTGSLDSKNSELVMSMLKNASKDRLVIVVTHQKELALKYADRIITLKSGEVINDEIINDNFENYSEFNIASSVNKNSIKSKIAFKFSFKWLKKNVLRLIISLFTFSISFGALATSFNFTLVNHDKIIEEAVQNKELTYLTLKKNNEDKEGFKDEEYQKLLEFVNEDDVVYSPENTFANQSVMLTKGDYKAVSTVMGSFINEDLLIDLNFDLVGRLPNVGKESKEVAITGYAAYLYGFLRLDEVNDLKTYNNLLDDTYIKCKSYDDFGSEIEAQYKVVGVINTHFDFNKPLKDADEIDRETYKKTQIDDGLSTIIYFSKECFKFNNSFYLNDPISRPKRFLRVFVRSLDLENVNSFINCYEKGTFGISSIYDMKFNKLDNLKETFNEVCLVICAIFILIALLLFISYILILINDNFKSIEVLRSLGASKKSIFKIFIFENLLISFIVSITSSILSLITGTILNSIVYDMVPFNIHLFRFSPFTFLFVFALMFIIFIIITYAKITNIYSKKNVIIR